MTAMTALARAELTLLGRNKLLLVNATVLPLLPIVGLAIFGRRIPEAVLPNILSSGVLVVMLLVVYYNVLAAFVSRREELVLKRLRVGEISDVQIVAGTMLPSLIVGTFMSTMLVISAVIAGMAFPVNPLLVVVALVGAIAVSAVLALCTTVITRNVEAAQITALPVMLLAVLPTMVTASDGALARLLDLAPYSPVMRLLDLGIEGGPMRDAVGPVAIMVGWIVIGTALAFSAFRWEPRN